VTEQFGHSIRLSLFKEYSTVLLWTLSSLLFVSCQKCYFATSRTTIGRSTVLGRKSPISLGGYARSGTWYPVLL
jgi:hypothetical protein